MPLIVHLPEIVFPFAVPCKVSVFPAGVPEFTVNPNVPFVLPLKFPLRVNDPLSVSPETKHPELLLKVNLEMLNDPSPFTTSDVPKLKAVTLLESINVAFHVPLTLAGLEELFAPQPTNIRPNAMNTVATKNFNFIDNPLVSDYEGAH